MKFYLNVLVLFFLSFASSNTYVMDQTILPQTFEDFFGVSERALSYTILDENNYTTEEKMYYLKNQLPDEHEWFNMVQQGNDKHKFTQPTGVLKIVK